MRLDFMEAREMSVCDLCPARLFVIMSNCAVISRAFQAWSQTLLPDRRGAGVLSSPLGDEFWATLSLIFIAKARGRDVVRATWASPHQTLNFLNCRHRRAMCTEKKWGKCFVSYLARLTVHLDRFCMYLTLVVSWCLL